MRPSSRSPSVGGSSRSSGYGYGELYKVNFCKQGTRKILRSFALAGRTARFPATATLRFIKSHVNDSLIDHATAERNTVKANRQSISQSINPIALQFHHHHHRLLARCTCYLPIRSLSLSISLGHTQHSIRSASDSSIHLSFPVYGSSSHLTLSCSSHFFIFWCFILFHVCQKAKISTCPHHALCKIKISTWFYLDHCE